MADQNVSTPIPAVNRVSLDEHAQAAAARIHPDKPETAGRVKSGAVGLPPLQRVQAALDQLQRHSENHARGEVWDYVGSSFASFANDVIQHAQEQRDILHAAADAAESMIGEMTRQIDEQGAAMAKKKDVEAQQEPPQLTTSGEPHPLQQGGYDANADPNLSSSESDVAALAAGHATKAQTEAMNAANAANTDDSDDDEDDSDDSDDDENKAKPKKRGRPKKS